MGRGHTLRMCEEVIQVLLLKSEPLKANERHYTLPNISRKNLDRVPEAS